VRARIFFSTRQVCDASARTSRVNARNARLEGMLELRRHAFAHARRTTAREPAHARAAFA